MRKDTGTSFRDEDTGGCLYRETVYRCRVTVTLGVFGDSASSPWPQSRRAGWPSFGLQTDHIPPSLSPIAITRVSSLASFNILACSSRAGHVIHLGASTNIWNNLPQFPKSYTATLSPILFFRLPNTILKFQVLKHLYTISSYGV